MTGFQLFGINYDDYVGQEMLILSGIPDVTPFGEFMILLIHYIYITTEFVSIRTMFTDYWLRIIVYLD